MSLWDDLTGQTASDMANKAAQDTFNKKNAAVSGYTSYADTLPGQYNALGAGYDPYTQGGTGALQMLMNGTGANGAAGNEAYTNAYQASPGYQSGLDTGMQALQRQLQAGNIGQSGAAAKAAARYGIDYSNKNSQQFWNNLMGLSGQGLQATGAQAGLGAQGLGAQGAARGSAFGGQMGNAETIGQGLVAGAQAKQQGVQGLLNAGTNLAGGFLGSNMIKKPQFNPFGVA